MRRISVSTSVRLEAKDITSLIKSYLHEIYAESGLVIIFSQHTTAGIMLNENADPAVRKDILDHLSRSIPKDAGFSHAEGNSDAHIKAALTGPSLSLMVEGGKLLLGQWQGSFLMAFDGPREREVWIKFLPELDPNKK